MRLFTIWIGRCSALGGVIFCFFLIMNPLWAQQGGQDPAPYLQLGVGGGQEAMGGTGVGLRNDPACGYYNPAGLSGLRGLQAEEQFTFLSLGQSLNYLTAGGILREDVFWGASMIYYSAGNDLQARSGPSVEPDSIFGDTEMTFLGSAAIRLDPRWSTGLNLKVFTESLGNFSGSGGGFDAGLQYRVDNQSTIGFVVQDPYSFMAYSNQSYQVFPATFKVGISHFEEKLAVRANLDLQWSSNLGLEPRLGGEWKPAEAIAIRGGLWAGDLSVAGAVPVVYFTTGLGLSFPFEGNLMEFDYTLLQDRLEPGALLNQVALSGTFL